MKKIEAIVRPEVIEDIKNALFAADIEGMTISQALGAGNQHGWTEYYRGTEVLVQMRAKVKIEIVLPDDEVDTVVDTIIGSAKTGTDGEVGDGKIFIYPVEEAIRIRTGERGDAAILTSKKVAAGAA
ncbi:MAG: P-II family nitrogen regulator [Coriobacteriia bacterium]|nr:P-II family nitrogen regulator [Coriobacteriia bacterium]MBS5478179.1 P-II family nitrogen regulator [Coriobacteriia bacterium]